MTSTVAIAFDIEKKAKEIVSKLPEEEKWKKAAERLGTTVEKAKEILSREGEATTFFEEFFEEESEKSERRLSPKEVQERLNKLCIKAVKDELKSELTKSMSHWSVSSQIKGVMDFLSEKGIPYVFQKYKGVVDKKEAEKSASSAYLFGTRETASDTLSWIVPDFEYLTKEKLEEVV